VSGTTILADGRLGWVLDARALATSARGVPHEEDGTKIVPKRVLVVDDSATTRELERTLLRAAGIDVEAVADGEEAWTALTGEAPFDVVLSDVEMPRLDGFSLLGRIRSTPRLAHLPVVLVTALEDSSDKQRALDMGASAYIVKSSFDEDELLDVIAHLL
jgi:two-component system chemotaxis sensor kinase CheA